MKKIMDKFKSNIKLNKKMVTFLITLMIIGIILGALFILILNPNDKSLVNEYINTFINNIKNNNLNYLTAIKNGILTNPLCILIIWILGISIIGIPVIVFMFFYKSFILGFSIASLIQQFKLKGCILSFAYIFPHELFNFISYTLITLYSLIFSFKLLYCTFNKINFNFKQVMNKYLMILIICLILTILSTIFEVFITPRLIKLVIPIIN